MNRIGRYIFYGAFINVTDVKYEGGDIYYFIMPDVTFEGWWLDSEDFGRLISSDQLLYVGPYNPITPKQYLKEFSF